jgi:hypothetical protein
MFTRTTGRSFNNNGALGMDFLDILLEDGRVGRLICLFMLYVKMDDGGSFVKGPRNFLWDNHLIFLSSYPLFLEFFRLNFAQIGTAYIIHLPFILFPLLKR